MFLRLRGPPALAVRRRAVFCSCSCGCSWLMLQAVVVGLARVWSQSLSVVKIMEKLAFFEKIVSEKAVGPSWVTSLQATISGPVRSKVVD